MKIGNTNYYVIACAPARCMGEYLAHTPNFDSNVPCPNYPTAVDSISIWRAKKGRGFRALSGPYVTSFAAQHHLTLTELCARYSDMDARTIAAIKAQENSQS